MHDTDQITEITPRVLMPELPSNIKTMRRTRILRRRFWQKHKCQQTECYGQIFIRKCNISLLKPKLFLEQYELLVFAM